MGFIGLGPDEAQYWTWSNFLDWGYYSKPPGIAFQIRLGTLLFGNTELGVRFGSLLLGSLIPLVIYFMAVRAKLDEKVAFWAALIMAFSPMGILASLFSITDVGMIFAWCLGGYCLLKDPPDFVKTGLWIAVGALFKWAVYFFWIAVLVGLLLFPQWRKKSFFVGVGLSLLGLIPPLIWNIQHNWVTFRHVGTTMIGGHGVEQGTTALMKGNALEFIGAQMLLLSPILFALLVYGWFRYKRQADNTLLYWGTVSSALFIVGFIIVASFQKMQGNWCIFAYPLALAVIPTVNLRWTKIGLAFSILLCTVVLAIPAIHKSNLVSLKFNPFKHNLGWEHLSTILRENGYQPENEFLFSDTYQMTSILSFYGPEQQRAYFLNLQSNRHNQFDLWPGMEVEQLGKTGIYVQTSAKSENCSEKRLKELEMYFEKVNCIGTFPLTVNKYIQIWICRNYNGKIPINAMKY